MEKCRKKIRFGLAATHRRFNIGANSDTKKLGRISSGPMDAVSSLDYYGRDQVYVANSSTASNLQETGVISLDIRSIDSDIII